MDQDLPQSSTVVPNQNKLIFKRILLICSAALLVIILTIGGILYTNPSLRPSFLSVQKESVSIGRPTGVIAQVGAEYLYQQTLTKTPKDELVRQSIVLQGAAADGLIKLDPSIYNSPQLDAAKRKQTTDNIQKQIDDVMPGIHGTVVFVWFNHALPPLTYDQAKQIAGERMNFYYNQVKNHRLTITEAAQQIQNDPKIKKIIDPKFQDSVSYDFSQNYMPNITFIPSFDKFITALPPGGLTPLYLAKDSEDTRGIKSEQKGIDAAYLFAEVTKKVTSGSSVSFSDWYADKYQKYEIKYY